MLCAPAQHLLKQRVPDTQVRTLLMKQFMVLTLFNNPQRHSIKTPLGINGENRTDPDIGQGQLEVARTLTQTSQLVIDEPVHATFRAPRLQLDTRRAIRSRGRPKHRAGHNAVDMQTAYSAHQLITP